jgi:hypothetical protein
VAVFTSGEPVKAIEDWLLGILRAAFPKEVYVIIGFKVDEELEPVPYDRVMIIYSGMNYRHYEKYNRNDFGFQIVYTSHLASTMLPHRRALAMLEKGREALIEKTPVGLLNPLPLQLKSEALGKNKKGCDCGPSYVQNWQISNEVSTAIIPNFDPCFGEPNSTIPAPVDYVTPIDTQYYSGVNPIYIITNVITNGNTTYIWDGANWILNPNYNPNLPTTNPRFYWDPTTGQWIPYPYLDHNFPDSYGNLPFLPFAFIKNIGLDVVSCKGSLLHHSDFTPN